MYKKLFQYKNYDDFKNIYYKTVYFDLPFLIFVKDGFKDKELEDWVEAYRSGQTDLPNAFYAPSKATLGGLIIGADIPVYVPEEINRSAYYVQLDSGKYVGIQFLKRVSQGYGEKFVGELFGDRTGRASFSSVRINFSLDDYSIDEIEQNGNEDLFISSAIEAVNKFIKVYRAITDKYYLNPITAEQIFKFTIVNDFTDGRKSSEIYYISVGELRGFGGLLDENDEKLIREKLIAGEEPSIFEVLRLDILNKLELNEWKLAVIESAILFETWLHYYVTFCYRNQGLTEEEINRKFVKKDKYGTPQSSTYIADKLVFESTGFDFNKTAEFNLWTIETRDVRNLIVHGKKNTVSKFEAERAAICTFDAINIIL